MLTQYIEAALRYIEIEESEDGDEFPDQHQSGRMVYQLSSAKRIACI
jgi:hypothetical protein